VKPQRNARWSRRTTFALRASFSFCGNRTNIAVSSGKLMPDEKIIVISDCAQDGAICSNKCAIMLSDTWGFSAGKHLPVDTVAHGNKLQATADAA
jgi:hypothetical protein